MPFLSSVAPGPSPMNMISIFSGMSPCPGTAWILALQRGQAWQEVILELSWSSLVWRSGMVLV